MANPTMFIGWEGLGLLLAFITLLIIVLVHMVSISFSMPNLAMWAKSEYAQVAVTVLIVVFAVGMRDAGNNITGTVTAAIAKASGNIELVGATNAYIDDPAKIAKAYIIQGPLHCEKNIYWAYYLRNLLVLEPLNSITFGVGNVEGVSGAFYLAGKISTAHYYTQNIAYLAVFHYIQYFLLQFSQYTMLQIFLPVGLALRAFPVTRGAGGFVTAFALGFAFIFPITYVLIVAMSPAVHYACTDVALQAQNAAVYPEGDRCFNNAGAMMAAVYDGTGKTKADKEYADLAIPFGQLYLQAMFYPMVALIVVFSFIRQTSSLFGADLAEIGRGLIKII